MGKRWFGPLVSDCGHFHTKEFEMKKILMLALVLAMGAVTISATGCGGGSSSTTGTKPK